MRCKEIKKAKKVKKGIAAKICESLARAHALVLLGQGTIIIAQLVS